jgi:hypothetical protein
LKFFAPMPARFDAHFSFYSGVVPAFSSVHE